MIRFISTLCGLVVLIGCLAEAQEPANQDLSRYPYTRRSRRAFPPTPNDPNAAAPTAPAPAGQNGNVPVPAPGQAQPGITPPVSTAAPATISQPALPENLPPPIPPQVTYRDGLLTVQTTNSTLAGLLTAIRNKTGIQFEGLEGGAPERVAVSLGPAPEAEVLAAILAGSKFDYVVLNRTDSPGIVQRVLLTPRGSPPAAGSPPPLNAQNRGDDDEDEQASTDAEPQDTPVRPPLTQVQPLQPPQQNQPSPTPEQLLERMKQMQQQQQQQQAAPQNQAPVKPPM